MDPTCREAIARVALSGPGVATLREAQAARQPIRPEDANKLNELIGALEASTNALSAGAAWAKVGGFVFVNGRDETPMFGTVRIGDKATVYWRECGEALSLFVARNDGLSALAVLHALLPREANTRRRDRVRDANRRAGGGAGWRDREAGIPACMGPATRRYRRCSTRPGG